MKTTLLTLLIAATVASASAVPLVTYSFSGAVGSEVNFAADGQPANATASPMTRGSGLTASAAADTFSASAWTIGSSLDVNDYYAFSLTPVAGFTLTLTQLVLDERRSGTGIRNWSVRSSLDSFASDLGLFSVPDDTLTRTFQTINLTAAFADLASALEFRVYGYAAETAAGTWRIDNVKIEGSTKQVTNTGQVPDTGATALLLSIPVLGLLTLHRFATRKALIPVSKFAFASVRVD